MDLAASQATSLSYDRGGRILRHIRACDPREKYWFALLRLPPSVIMC